jgi:hypothetical protein
MVHAAVSYKSHRFVSQIIRRTVRSLLSSSGRAGEAAAIPYRELNISPQGASVPEVSGSKSE